MQKLRQAPDGAVVRSKGRRKKRREARKGWPAWLSSPLCRPDWLPDDRRLRASMRAFFSKLKLDEILGVMRENPPDPRKLRKAADELVKMLRQPLQPSDPKREMREQRRLDARRIKKRVEEVRKVKIDAERPSHGPTRTEHAWQTVASEMQDAAVAAGLGPRLLPRSVRRARDQAAFQDKTEAMRLEYEKLDTKGVLTPEGKALRRWVERNL
jgi:hypothetical protein